MKNKTVIVLVVAALGLFAYIFFVERDSMTTSDLQEREDRVFGEFARDSVTALTVSGPKGEVTARKIVDADGEERWRLTAPADLDADASAVRSVLAAIDFVLADRTVEGSEEARDPRYGLVEPRIRASFEMKGGAKTAFAIGAKDASGEKVYVALEGEDRFHAVEKDFYDSLDVGPQDLRDKHLLGRDSGFDGAREVSLERGGAIQRFSREGPDSPWKLERDGEKILAASDQVGELLREVERLRASEFLADGADEAAIEKWGLASSGRKLTVEGKTSAAVSFGSSCGQEGDGIAATVVGSGVIACVPKKITEVLDRPRARFEEMRPAVFEEEGVKKIEVKRGGRQLALEWDDDEDRWTIPGEGGDGAAIDQGVVGDLLETLYSARGDELVFGAEALEALGEPDATVALELDAGRDGIELEIWGPAEGESLQAVRRAGEPAFLRLEEDVLSRLSTDPLAFRQRVVENGDPDDIASMVIQGPAAQELVREDGEWKVVAPVEADADDGAARDLAGFAARIEVSRFVSRKAAPEHGLDRPWAVLEAVFEGKDGDPDRTLRILLGDEVGDSGERYGRVEDGETPVFAISASDAGLIGRPAVARDAVGIDTTAATKVEIDAGSRGKVTAVMKDGQWIGEEMPDLDSVTLKRLLVDLGSMKAVRTSSFDVGKGFEEPGLTVRIWSAGQDAPRELVAGARTPDEAEETYLARVSGLDVAFAVPARIIDDLASVASVDANDESRHIVTP